MRWGALGLLFLACGDSGGGMAMPDAAPPDAPAPDAALPDASPFDAPLTYDPYPNCPSCQHAQYVVNAMTIPQSNAQAMLFGCDINADGEIDNQLGKVLGALKAASPSVDIQSAVNASFQNGSFIMLYDLEYDATLIQSNIAGLRAFTGAHDPADGLTPPAFYMGQGRFTTVFENGSGLGGQIAGSVGQFGPNEAVLQLTLLAADPPMTLPLKWASVSGTLLPSSISNGKLCGAMDMSVVRTTLIPQLADLLSAQVKAGGSNANTIKSLFDTDHSCDTDPACMSPTSAGICRCITSAEIENNSIIKSLLGPDLDLDPNETNPFVTDPTDPTFYNDALSIGVGLNANTATFPLP